MAIDIAASAIESPIIIALITGIFGIFGGGALVALLRVNVDRHKIIVDTAQGAVIVQSGVIEDLNDELHRVKDELTMVHKDYRQCREDTRQLRAVNRELSQRIETLEQAG
jgi:predicted transcriptional regulator